MTRLDVSALAEAAWVGMVQTRLEEALRLALPRLGLEPSPNYGSYDFPAYKWGYHLADQTRYALSIGDESPVQSLRVLAEEQFGIPIVYCELSQDIAGATVEIGNKRALIINLGGK